MITQTKEFHDPKIGCMSLVGIHGKEFPLDFGNYFWLSSGLRIINMWAENLEEAAKRFSLKEIECTVFSDGKHKLAFITDSRIPKEWFSRLCITGCGWGSVELCKACLNFAGLENISWYCGCEAEEDSPSISGCYTYDEFFTETAFCHKCKREWVIRKVLREQ